MSDILQVFSPAHMPLIIEENFCAYKTLFSMLPQSQRYSDADITWLDTSIALSSFNGVYRMHVKSDGLSPLIECVLTHFRQRVLPFQWHVGPTSSPTNAGEILQSYGIAHNEDEPGMALDLSLLNEEPSTMRDIAIIPVQTDEDLYQWARVWGCGAPDDAIEAFFAGYRGLDRGPDSPLRFYLGLLDGEPVSIVLLFFGAGVAQIKHVITVHRVRRRGIGTAMTLMAAREARKLGYRIAVLSASPLGINIYRNLGFREYCTMSSYEWYPDSH